MIKKKEVYPVWKKVAWRYVRVFLASFLVLIGSQIAVINTQSALNSLIVSAITAAISAVCKQIREDIGDKFNNPIHRLPL